MTAGRQHFPAVSLDQVHAALVNLMRQQPPEGRSVLRAERLAASNSAVLLRANERIGSVDSRLSAAEAALPRLQSGIGELGDRLTSETQARGDLEVRVAELEVLWRSYWRNVLPYILDLEFVVEELALDLSTRIHATE